MNTAVFLGLQASEGKIVHQRERHGISVYIVMKNVLLFIKMFLASQQRTKLKSFHGRLHLLDTPYIILREFQHLDPPPGHLLQYPPRIPTPGSTSFKPLPLTQYLDPPLLLTIQISHSKFTYRRNTKL